MSKKAKKIAKTTAAAIGGAAIEGGIATIQVMLAPVHIVGSAVIGGINAGLKVNKKGSIKDQIKKKLK